MERVRHYVKYEVGYRPNSHWEEKDFNTKWEAEKFAEEWRRKHSGGAIANSEWVGQPSAFDQAQREKTAVICNRMLRNWNGF